MAMALSTTVKPIKLRGNNFLLVIARIVASGSYIALGDLLDLKSLNPNSPKQPRAVIINSESGFVYKYDLANKKVKVFQATTSGTNLPLAEHTAAALVAGVTGDVITAWVLFA
jgi:hypothetical protein